MPYGGLRLPTGGNNTREMGVREEEGWVLGDKASQSQGGEYTASTGGHLMWFWVACKAGNLLA